MAVDMDEPVSQVLRMLQRVGAEMEERVLGSYSIWLCLGCGVCEGRCPQEVDIPRIMDYLREESLRKGCVNRRARDIVAFHKAFFDGFGHTVQAFAFGVL